MFQDIITKYTFVILSYELITMDIVKSKLIDILLDKILYILILLLMSILGSVFNISCCSKYSSEEKEILKLIKAGDKMDKLNGTGEPYYFQARRKIKSSLPFTDINDNILSKMDRIEKELGWQPHGAAKKKKPKKKAD